MDTACNRNEKRLRDGCFNGAMTSQPWILSCRMDDGGRSHQLQWSHDLSAMDTCCLARQVSKRRQCFNGAMTSQPWIPGCRLPFRRKYPRFNGAMTSQPWIPDLPKQHLHLFQSFNGAMTSQPWIRRKFRIFRPNSTVCARNSRFRRAFSYSTGFFDLAMQHF